MCYHQHGGICLLLANLAIIGLKIQEYEYHERTCSMAENRRISDSGVVSFYVLRFLKRFTLPLTVKVRKYHYNTYRYRPQPGFENMLSTLLGLWRYRIISYYPVFRQENASLKVERCMESEIGPFNTPINMATTGGL